jgi:hypothetical protein
MHFYSLMVDIQADRGEVRGERSARDSSGKPEVGWNCGLPDLKRIARRPPKVFKRSKTDE